MCANVRTLVCYESAEGAVFMGLPGVRGRSCDRFRALNGPDPVLRTLTQPERRYRSPDTYGLEREGHIAAKTPKVKLTAL